MADDCFDIVQVTASDNATALPAQAAGGHAEEGYLGQTARVHPLLDPLNPKYDSWPRNYNGSLIVPGDLPRYSECTICKKLCWKVHLAAGVCPKCVFEHQLFHLQIIFGQSKSTKYKTALRRAKSLPGYMFQEGRNVVEMTNKSDFCQHRKSIEKLVFVISNWVSFSSALNGETITKDAIAGLLEYLQWLCRKENANDVIYKDGGFTFTYKQVKEKEYKQPDWFDRGADWGDNADSIYNFGDYRLGYDDIKWGPQWFHALKICSDCKKYVWEKVYINGLCPKCIIKQHQFEFEISFRNSKSKYLKRALKLVQGIPSYSQEGDRHVVRFDSLDEYCEYRDCIDKLVLYAGEWKSFSSTLNGGNITEYQIRTLADIINRMRDIEKAEHITFREGNAVYSYKPSIDENELIAIYEQEETIVEGMVTEIN